MQSQARTVDEYLAELEPERRDTVAAMRETVNRHLPEGYEEGMLYGMIGWYIPLERYPETYNGQPLAVAGLAGQKRHASLYLNCVYADTEDESRFRERWEATGRRLDMGKSCVRFKRLEDVALDVVGETLAATPVDAFIGMYERSRRR